MPKEKKGMFDQYTEEYPDTKQTDKNFSEDTGGENNGNNPTEVPFEETTTPPPPQQEENLNPDNSNSNNWNPLDGEVKKRDYTTINSGKQEERVPEPKMEPPSTPPPPPPNKKDPASQQPTNPNPGMQDLPPKDQRLASTMLVDGIIKAYKMAWGGVSKFVQVSDDQIMDWIMHDKISKEIMVPTQDGEEISILEYYQNYNTQAAAVFEVTDEFVESVRDSMIREFTKRGWGVTDMQNILIRFGMDSGEKLGGAIQLKLQQRFMTKAVFKLWDEIKKANKAEQDRVERERNPPKEQTVREVVREVRVEKEVIRPEKPETTREQVKKEVFNEKDVVQSYEMPNNETAPPKEKVVTADSPETNPDITEVPFTEDPDKKD